MNTSCARSQVWSGAGDNSGCGYVIFAFYYSRDVGHSRHALSLVGQLSSRTGERATTQGGKSGYGER